MKPAGLAGWTGAILAVLIAFSACGQNSETITVAGGDLQLGRIAIQEYGCGACHMILGVPSANGNVGPPLSGIAEQVYLAGILPNWPAEMILLIRNPRQVNPRTAMPEMGVTERDARHIAAYLYTLQ